MSQEKVDKTKHNLGVSHLDEKEKKDLYNKFVEAGGQVIQESRRKGFTDFDRGKQKNFKSRLETRAQVIEGKGEAVKGGRPEKGSDVKRAVRPPADMKSRKNPLKRFIERWIVRFRLFFMGVTDFSGSFISRGYLEELNTDVKFSLQELQLVYLDLFRQNPRMGRTITGELDAANPLYVELIEMMSAVFDRTVINQIVEHHLNFPNIGQKAVELKQPLMSLFKRLYVLYPYREHIQEGFERAIAHQMRLEKGKASLYTAKRKRVKNDLYLVFYKFFKALYWLQCDYQGIVVPLWDPFMERLLAITMDDKPGRRKRSGGSTEEEPQQQDGTADGGQDEAGKEGISEDVKKGLDIMYRLKIKDMRSVYDKDDSFRFVKDIDKILMAHLLFREFDEEYSFIFTTNKIKYNVQFTPAGKVDFKPRLTDLYNELRNCMNAFMDYADAMAHYEKVREERPTGSAQYMEYSNRLTGLEKKRNGIGKNVRMIIRAFMEKVVDVLKILMEDMNRPQQIIQNPQDVLSFESSIEGSRKMEGRKVYEAVTAAYQFASAFVHRLNPGGDLHGELEFKEEDFLDLQKKIEESTSAESGDKEPEDPALRGGVIKELDDLF
jgi:hypothetical protein